MKKLGRRFISGLIAAAFCVACFPFTFVQAAQNQAEAATYEEDITILKVLGIIRNYEEGGYYAANLITRGEAAYMICNLMNIVVDGSSYQLEEGGINWAEAGMNTAVECGIFSDGDWESYMRAQDLATVLIRIMGYEPQAESRGGYPKGYMTVARNLDLLNGISVSGENEISKGEAAKMFMNASTIDIMQRTSIGSLQRYELTSGQNLFSKYLDVSQTEGKVTGTEISYLEKEGNTAKGYVEIDGQLFQTMTNAANELLGSYVKYYWKAYDGDAGMILYLAESEKKQSRSVLICADDLISYSDRTYRYYDGSRIKNVQVDAGADIIFNHRFSGALSAEQYMPDNGSVELVDTDGSGTYDLLFITWTETLVVQTYNADTSMLYDKYGSLSLEIDESDADSHICIQDEKGANISVSQLRPMDVLSLTVSLDQKAIFGAVSRNAVTGTVSAVKEGNNGRTEVEIDRKKYEVCDSYMRNGKITLRPGVEGTFYLDINGAVAAVQSGLSASELGYMIKVWNDEDVPEEKLMIKLFLANGTFKTMEAEGALKVDGTNYKNMEKAAAALGISDSGRSNLIRYETDRNGKLSMVDTPYYDIAMETEESLHKTHELEALRWKTYPRIFGNKIAVDDQTCCFSVPKNEDELEEANYEILPASYFSNDNSYSIEGYEIGRNHGAAAAIITFDLTRGTELDKDSTVALIGQSVETYDEEEGEVAYELSCYGTEVKDLMLEPDAAVYGVAYDSGAADIQRGDIVRYTTNKKGKISKIAKIYDYKTKSRTSAADPEGGETVLGYVIYKSAPYIRVSLQKPDEGIKMDESDFYVYRPEMFKMYIYDGLNVKTATIDDLLDYDAVGSDCSNILVSTRYSDARSLFIIQ